MARGELRVGAKMKVLQGQDCSWSVCAYVALGCLHVDMMQGSQRVLTPNYFVCDAVCCSVLQCVAVCFSKVQCVVVCFSVLQCVAVCCTRCIEVRAC